MRTQRARDLCFTALVWLAVIADDPVSSDVQQAGPLTWIFLGAVALAVVAGVLLKRPSSNARFDARPPQLAQRGDQIHYALGRRLVSMQPVAAWARFTREEDVGGGKKGPAGGGAKQTIYYEHGVHVLCLGPANGLYKILKGENIIWEGEITPADTPSGTALQDFDGNTFVIYWGEESQPVNTAAAPGLGGVSSRWPYVCYVHWIENRLGTSATWGQYDYEVDTTCNAEVPLDGFNCAIAGCGLDDEGGMNGASMLWQLLTGAHPHGLGIRFHGDDIDYPMLNCDSLIALGSLLETENLAQNMAILDGRTVQQGLADILSDMGVFMVQEKGQLAFMPLREGQDVLELDDNVILDSNPEFEIQHGGFGDDRVLFEYPDIRNNYRTSDIFTDDDATARQFLRKNTRNVQMPSITSRCAAAVVADRRKQLLLADANSITFKGSRSTRRLLPGHVVRIASVGELRITAVELETESPEAKITASINEFALVNADWVPGFDDPDDPADSFVPDTFQRVIEVPRRFAGEQMTIAVIRGRATGDGQGANVWVSNDGVTYNLAGEQNSVAAYGRMENAFVTVPIADFRPYRHVEEALPNILFNTANAQRLSDLSNANSDWYAVRQAMMLGEEVMAVQSFAAVGGEAYTPNNVRREQLYTCREQYPWFDGDDAIPVLVFDPENLTSVTDSSWVVGQKVYVKCVPQGVALAEVEALEITLKGKALAPLPCHNVQPTKIDGSGDRVFTWDYRLNVGSGTGSGERVAGDAIPDDPGPEGTFTIRIKDEGLVTVREVTDLTSPTYTWTTSQQNDDGLAFNDLFIEVVQVLNGIESPVCLQEIKHADDT